MPVPQRACWNGSPEQLSPVWALRKGSKVAEYTVWTSQFGFELRLVIGRELVQSQVCYGQEQMIPLQEQSRAALETKGWTKSQ